MKMRRLICIVLSMLCISAATVTTVSAKKNYNAGTSYKYYTTCKLRDTRKSASATIKVWNTTYGYRNDVKVTDGNGRYLWSERGGIAWSGQRTFYLGNNHKSYRIYVKAQCGSVAVNALYSNNCTMS